jgi:hypothetical protein
MNLPTLRRAGKYFAPAAKPLLLLFLLSLAFGAVSFARAQAVPNQGLTISPFLLERKMEKGDSSDEIIDITNTSSRPLPVLVTINDFLPVGEDGQQAFLDPGQGDPHYSLSSWIHITSNPKPILGPNEKTSIHFTITAPQNADDGGHYGAILFTFQPGQVEGTAVAVEQKLGAIILVKLGKAVENGQITQFGAEHSFYNYPPVTFVTRFKNLGNVHVKPRGGITITNMFGSKVATVVMNENANNVLANSERQFKSTWNDSFGFGHYTASLKLVYGDSGQVETVSTGFWVIPWKLTLAVALGLFILILIFLSSLRRYNRWILNQAYCLNKPPTRRRK